MKENVLYGLLALTACLGTVLSQATSLLDFYEAESHRMLNVGNLKRTSPWEDLQLACPSKNGGFENTKDCYNFFSSLCKLIDNTKSNCSEEYQRQCLSAINSICEEREKVTTDSPFSTRSEPTTTEEITTAEEITVLTTVTTTTRQPTTTFRTPKPRTTEEPIKPTGPPETSCSEDDLDCIIDDTGVTPDWFKCPEDIGSYPHPISNKLFIFCINWKPSVKKCGKNLLYSVRLRTCVNPGAEYAYNLFMNLK